VVAARTNRYVIIGYPMEQADRFAGQLVVIPVCSFTGRIEADMGRELDTRRCVHPAKPLVARIHGGNRTFRETHHSDPSWINPGIWGRNPKGLIRINNPRQRLSLALVMDCARSPLPSEAVEWDHRHTDAVQFIGPAAVKTLQAT